MTQNDKSEISLLKLSLYMPQTFSKIPSSTPQKWGMFNSYADR